MNRHNGGSIDAGCDEIVLCDEHVLRCKLWQSGKLFLGLFQKLPRIAIDDKVLARRWQNRKADVENIYNDGKHAVEHGAIVHEKEEHHSKGVIIQLGHVVGRKLSGDALVGPFQVLCKTF